jgi:acyl dehydratase
MKQKQHIGATTAERMLVIERGLVERFVDALDLSDPLSTDEDAAKEAGLRGLMLPNVAAGSLGNFQSAVELLELRPKQVLHSKESVVVLEPICVGDELRLTTRIRDLYEQQVSGNPMGFVNIECLGCNAKGDVVFESQRVLAVRGGFPRR